MASRHDWMTGALLLLASTAAFAEEAPKPPAFRLGDAAVPSAYELRLAIDPSEPTFTGEATLAFRVQRATPVLWLNATDLSIDSVEVKQGERRVEVEVLEGGKDFVGLKSRAEPFAAVDTVAMFRYRGRLEPLSTRGLFRQQEGGDWYVISQFEAMSARRAFPCFDEPAWKTPWKVTIDTPAANVAVSNTPEVRAADLGNRPGWRRHEFAPTKPLPSYLVALAVGPYDVVDGGVAGINRTPLRYLAPKGRGAEARYAREATPRILEILEEYFGMAYPFEKLDAVVIPQAVGFGAMENVGMITYDAYLLLAGPARETIAFRRRYAGIAAHEIAHMWFGNLVTLAWWDDIWLNEAFASWMAEKARYRFNPQWERSHYRARSRAYALATDRLAVAHPIYNPVNTKEDLSGGFSAITYDKGSAVLEMFETSVGPERFRDGVRGYMKRHAYGSATSADFFGSVGAAAGRAAETLAAFEAFVRQPGVPLVDAALRCAPGGVTLELSQQRLRPKGSTLEEKRWMTPACFRVAKQGTTCHDLHNGAQSIPLASCPDWLVGNADGAGYFVMRYDDALLKRLEKQAPSLPVEEASVLLGDSALLAQSGLVAMETALDLADAGFRHASPVVRLAAVRVLLKLEDAWLDARALRRKREVIAKRVQPLARQLGWRERDSESDAVRDLRVAVLPLAARSPGGEALRTQARKLALAWQRDRGAIPAAMVGPVLETAGRFADRPTYDLLESLAITTHDASERRDLQAALAKVRDPHLRARSFALSLHRNADRDAVNGRDLVLFLRDALEDEANRAPAFDYVRAHFDELVAKMPEYTPGRFTTYLQGLCTRAERDVFVAFFEDRAPRFRGGKQRYDEALETIELCIAARS